MFIVLLVLAGIAISGIKIIPQSRAYVIERLGAYHRTMQTGLNFVIPFIERIANNVSLKEIVKDFAPQPAQQHPFLPPLRSCPSPAHLRTAVFLLLPQAGRPGLPHRRLQKAAAVKD